MFKKFKEMPTSKKLIYYLFANCTIIEIFTLIVTFISVLQVQETLTAPDFAPLLALIGAFVTETIGYLIYTLKAGKENTKGGIIYDLALKKLEMENEEIYEDEVETEEEGFING